MILNQTAVNKKEDIKVDNIFKNLNDKNIKCDGISFLDVLNHLVPVINTAYNLNKQELLLSEEQTNISKKDSKDHSVELISGENAVQIDIINNKLNNFIAASKNEMQLLNNISFLEIQKQITKKHNFNNNQQINGLEKGRLKEIYFSKLSDQIIYKNEKTEQITGTAAKDQNQEAFKTNNIFDLMSVKEKKTYEHA